MQMSFISSRDWENFAKQLHARGGSFCLSSNSFPLQINLLKRMLSYFTLHTLFAHSCFVLMCYSLQLLKFMNGSKM